MIVEGGSAAGNGAFVNSGYGGGGGATGNAAGLNGGHCLSSEFAILLPEQCVLRFAMPMPTPAYVDAGISTTGAAAFGGETSPGYFTPFSS
jgi:hypothetical protein